MRRAPTTSQPAATAAMVAHNATSPASVCATNTRFMLSSASASVTLRHSSTAANASPATCRWRGFALPRLQQRYSPVRATLVLELFWSLWHLPIGPQTLLWIVPLALLYTWLFNRTHSIVLCVLLHPASPRAEPPVARRRPDLRRAPAAGRARRRRPSRCDPRTPGPAGSSERLGRPGDGLR